MVSTPNVGPPPGGSMASYTTTLNMRPSSINGTSSTITKAGRTSVALPPTTAPTPIPEKVTLPLSARHAEPLDLTTVERRGQPNESKETDSKPSRPHGLQEAPTFRPTEEEFKNPMEYIRKIAPEGRKYGIAKIIPPDGWNPDFAIDTEVSLPVLSFSCALLLLGENAYEEPLCT
jgi:histone demethylase JARID1